MTLSGHLYQVAVYALCECTLVDSQANWRRESMSAANVPLLQAGDHGLMPPALSSRMGPRSGFRQRPTRLGRLGAGGALGPIRPLGFHGSPSDAAGSP